MVVNVVEIDWFEFGGVCAMGRANMEKQGEGGEKTKYSINEWVEVIVKSRDPNKFPRDQ